MTTPGWQPDHDAVNALYTALFGDCLDAGDDLAVYRELTRRIATVEAALELARTRRCVILAWWSRARWSYQQIAERVGDLSAARVGVLVARGKQALTK